MTFAKKITVMSLLGALGATVGAVVGEALFLGKGPLRAEPRQICLLFDVSGSMGEAVVMPGGERVMSQLEALQEAARDFVRRQDLELDAMGLTVFSSDARIITNLSHDGARIERDIASLSARGGTNLGRGFDLAREALASQEGQRWILLFSDGKPESSSTNESPEAAALSAASRVRDDGIQIVAIGTRLADANLLTLATGAPQNVIVSDPQALHEAFRRSEEVINRQMLASTGSAVSFKRSVALTGLWAALIAIGAGTGLVLGQNRHLRRQPLNAREAIVIVIGGVVTGLLAGAAGQTLFYVLSETDAVVAIGRVVAWAMLGCGVGYGMGFFVPNLCRKRAAVAGAAGGVMAAFAFLTVVPVVGDTIGRLLGAAILGLCTGMTTVLVEAVYRKAWLVVHWSAKEQSSLALGESPILVGAGSDAHVLLAEADSPVPVMARITLADGVIRLKDGETGSERFLSDGDTLTYGRIVIEVRASAGAAAAFGAQAAARERAAEREQRRQPEVSDAVQRARAREEKWYDVEVSSTTSGSSAPRER
ncbi:MAG: vWA domain-containing protein [Planctomycetota bacterium]|jgi:Ca-activated chloride channel family protein